MRATLPAVQAALNSAPASDEVFTYHATEYKLQKIRNSSAIDEKIVSNAQILPTEEKTSLQIMATISQTTVPARYYVYTKDANSYIVTDSKIFLHVSPVYPANPANFNFDVSDYLLLSSRITQKTEVTNNNFKRILSGISSIKESGKSVYIAVYFSDDASSVYRAESDLFTYQGSTVTASQTQQTIVTGETVAGQRTTGDEKPVIVVTPNTPTPLPQSQQQMAQLSPTTLCTGLYSDPINRYNRASDVDSRFREGRTTIPCATIATDAKTKLTVTLTDGTFMKPGPFTFKDVAMENKEDKWVGFMMDQETKQWIQLEVKEKKLTYAVCLDQCAETSSTAPTYRQKRDLEVKHDKDKKYKFEGGTVEYTEIDPFNKGNLALILGLSIGGSILVIILVVIALLVFTNRESVGKGVNAIATQMRNARDNALSQLQSLRGNPNTSS
jgi:hypothetical protein